MPVTRAGTRMKKDEVPSEQEELIQRQTKGQNVLKAKAIDNEPSTWQLIFAYCVVLFSAVLCVTSIYRILSKKESNESLWQYLTLPRTVGDARKIASLILRYKDDHYYSVFSAYFATYILLQSLCIPGSIVLSILAGYLFPAPLALLIICTCSTLGASTCYIMIFRHKKWLLKFLGGDNSNYVERFDGFVQAKIREHHSNLFLCVFTLRATPIFPNWMINLCSPIINLPFMPFMLGTFVGVAPLSVIHVCTGRILNDLSNDQSLVDWQSVLMTSLIAMLVSILVYIIKRIN